MNENMEQFGLNRLCQAVSRLAKQDLGILTDELTKLVHAWQVRQNDDVTVVAVRYLG